MTNDAPVAPGWFPDEQFGNQERWWDGRTWTEHVRSKAPEGGAVQPATSAARGQAYVVLQVVLKERLLGTGSGNLTQLEGVINEQAARGYRLHTITTAASGSKGIGGGDRIQATMVFERL
jgi:predicted deacetylase